MLVENTPAAHRVPFVAYGGEEFLSRKARDVHIEGAMTEAAFRSLFYRDLPCPPPTRKENEEKSGGTGIAPGGKDEESRTHRKDRSLPRHQYEIVVCHMNVIRYFTLRALQLPPEAWLRLGGDNGSITHLKIRPTGNVSLQCFGDRGHMTLEETTFGMRQGLE